jgi:hypothetical protein
VTLFGLTLTAFEVTLACVLAASFLSLLIAIRVRRRAFINSAKPGGGGRRSRRHRTSRALSDFVRGIFRSKRLFSDATSAAFQSSTMSLNMANLELRKAIEANLSGNGSGSNESWEIDPSSVELIKKVASGSGGHVYKGKFGGKIVAVKEMMASAVSPGALASFRNEVAMLTQLNHPSVVRFFGTCMTDVSMFIVMEYCSVDLNGYLKAMEATEAVFLHVSCQLASAMDFLHSRNVIHRDLKPGNQSMLFHFIYITLYVCSYTILAGTLYSSVFGST